MGGGGGGGRHPAGKFARPTFSSRVWALISKMHVIYMQASRGCLALISV